MSETSYQGGRIVDPANNVDMIGDVLIEGGLIKAVSLAITAQAM